MPGFKPGFKLWIQANLHISMFGSKYWKGGIAAFEFPPTPPSKWKKDFFFSFPILNRWKYRSLFLASLVLGDLFSLPTLSTGDSDLQEKGAHSCARPAGK